MNAAPLLNLIARLLAKHRPEAILIGNAAAELQGSPVTTVDLDFMFRATAPNLRKVSFGRHDLLVASLRDIIRSKKAAGRAQDRAVLPILRKTVDAQEEDSSPGAAPSAGDGVRSRRADPAAVGAPAVQAHALSAQAEGWRRLRGLTRVLHPALAAFAPSSGSGAASRAGARHRDEHQRARRPSGRGKSRPSTRRRRTASPGDAAAGPAAVTGSLQN
jgi:hypothetical protein